MGTKPRGQGSRGASFFGATLCNRPRDDDVVVVGCNEKPSVRYRRTTKKWAPRRTSRGPSSSQAATAVSYSTVRIDAK